MPKAACCRAVQLSISCVPEQVQALYIAMISSMAFRLVGFLYVCLAKYYRWPGRFLSTLITQNHVTKIEVDFTRAWHQTKELDITRDHRGKIFALNQRSAVFLS